MGIIDYFDHLGDRWEHKRTKQHFSDPDVEAAYEELNDYLKGNSEKKRFDDEINSGKRNFTGNPNTQKNQRPNPTSQIPETIKQAFAELGLSPEATPDECKATYKKLLKIHHPDRHAGHEGNMKKATEKSARINSAFDRIEKWRQTGKAE